MTRRTRIIEPYAASFSSTGNPSWLVWAQAEWSNLPSFGSVKAACTSKEAAEAAERLLKMPSYELKKERLRG